MTTRVSITNDSVPNAAHSHDVQIMQANATGQTPWAAVILHPGDEQGFHVHDGNSFTITEVPTATAGTPISQLRDDSDGDE